RLGVTVVKVLEAGLVHRPLTEYVRIAHLERMLRAVGVVGLRRERKLPDPSVGFIVLPELVAHRQDILRAELIIEPGTEVHPHLGIEHGLAEWNLLAQIRTENEGTHDVRVGDVPAKYIEEKRCALVDGAADVSIVELRMIAGLFGGEGVPRVEVRGIPIHEDLAVVLAHSGLGGDLDAAIAELVVFRREGILVDPDLENRGLGRELAASEAVNIDLASVRPCRGSSQRLQLGLQFIGVIGERLELLSRDDQRSGVALGIDANGWRLTRDSDLLHFLLDLKRDAELPDLARGDLNLLLLIQGETFCNGLHLVLPGRQSLELINPVPVPLYSLSLSCR